MTDREKHIKNLSYIMDSMPDDACGEWRDSLAYAISSLKTDEAYQIMYDGEDIYTKADVVAMLEEIQSGIREIEEDMSIRDSKAEMGFDRWIKDSDAENIIQEKINKLRVEL